MRRKRLLVRRDGYWVSGISRDRESYYRYGLWAWALYGSVGLGLNGVSFWFFGLVQM